MLKKYLIYFLTLPVLSNAIVIDGVLDEAEWETAHTITEFYETSPYTLKKYKDETIAYIFSNPDGIYVGFINYQDESTMLSKKTMRDEMSSLNEKNSINIDFDGDRTKAYIIAVALGDSIFDATKIQSGDFKTDWDGDWIAKTKKYKNYWTSEFFLPWNMTLMNQSSQDKRKINYTALRYRSENQSWVSSAGTMAMRSNYFQNLTPLEINNYTKSKLNFFPYLASNKNSSTNFEETNIGAEIFYNSGKGDQLNLTLNPDFGQAESDEVIVNFSAQETFYKEKRAFFNENQTLFDISNYNRYAVINTRRVGSRPSYNCASETKEDECNENKKSYSDIDFALRYTKKQDDNQFGLFAAHESDESFSAGREYYALRGKSKLDNKTIGYMLTHVIDDIDNSSSTVNVIDYINVKSDQLTTYFDFLSSKKNEVNGEGFRAQYTYKPDRLSRNSASILYFDKNFYLNDFGYLQRNDWFHFGIGHNIQNVDFPKNSNLRLKEFNIDFNYDSDTDGNSNPYRIEQKNKIEFKDSSKFSYDFSYKSSGKNTTITRKDDLYPFVKIKNNFSITGDYEAINYKYWTYDWRVSFDKAESYNSWDSKGYKKRFFKIAGSIFPSDNLKLKSEFRIKKEKEWLNWISDNNLAVYDLNQRIISFNLNWFKGNKHEIRLKSQFVALEAKNPRALLAEGNGTLLNSDKEVSSFSNGITSFQIRYRYEIAPLSNIYLVYTKGGNVYEEDDDRSFSNILKDPWNGPDNEILSLKFRLKY
ncbi:MAG: hypothetical protein CMD46_05395 [Gammaproteobacteria bacterium]|nr:hypothetical protein [Gammaproteobacteria bacterium]